VLASAELFTALKLIGAAYLTGDVPTGVANE
jgi:hypothetical protein